MMERPDPSNQKSVDLTKLKSYLISNISRELEGKSIPVDQRREVILSMLQQAYQSTKLQLPVSLKEQLFHDILDEITGYGPLQTFLEDPDISEVMVNGPHQIYIERNGKLIRTQVKFEDDNAVLRIIDRIVSPLGRHIDRDNPTVDARLPDGSRVNAVISPVAIDGPSVTIRKFQKDKLTVEQLINYGSLTAHMAEFIRACVIARLNVIISGGTGSGKTTLLNVLSGFIPEEERIVTIEDAAELKLQQEHVVRLETKPADSSGLNEVPIRHLVRNALRMRPDRIVVGEVRGGEALDMLQAMNTGHDGSLTTLHANTPRDAISRLETMSLMSGMDLPLKVIRQQIASAVDLIIQQTRLRDGTRKVTAVTEVAGMEGDTVVMSDIFRFDQTGISSEGKILGELKPTGIRPLFISRLEAAGFNLPATVFGANIGDMISSQRRR
jgi:pilus assembly protein CpaF